MSFIEHFGTFRTDEARVISVCGRRLTVAFNPECGKDTSCIGCSACARSPHAARLSLTVAKTAAPALGQTVKVRRFVPGEASASIVIFALPLLTAAAAAMAAGALRGRDSEKLIVFAAFAGLAAGMAVSALLDKTLRTAFPPRIVG